MYNIVYMFYILKNMRLFCLKAKNKGDKMNTNSRDFYLLPQEDQQKIIKQGAKEFSKNFTKTITRLANE